MRPRPLFALLVIASAIALSGCGAGKLVGLGGSATPSAPAPPPASEPVAASEAKPSKKERQEAAKRMKEEARRRREEAKRAEEMARLTASDAKRDSKHRKEDPRPTDELGEAKLKASEQPNEPWWPYHAAELEAKAGRREASEASLREALQREPAYPPALASLSRTLYEQGRHGEAIELLSRVRDGSVTLDDDDRAALVAGLALHESAAGRETEARAAIGQLGRSGGDAALGVSAVLAVRSENKETALERTAEAVRAAPKSAANHNNRGIALLRSADPDAAEKEFERAIELDPSLPGPYYNLAILERFYRMDTAAATKRFQQYWARSQADPDSLFSELGRGKPAQVAEDGDKR